MDPFEPIPVDPEPKPPADENSPVSDALKEAENKLPGPYFDAADVGLGIANAAAFVAITGIGGEMEKAVTGAVEAYGDPLVGSADFIDEAVSRATDSPGPQSELADGCSGCAVAIVLLLTASVGSALAFAN